jgi:membrane associated rhomboid family serine protease
MLIPIGHDQATVRRMPWVTFSIIGLCLVIFIYTLVAPGDEEAVVAAEVRAVEYYIAHPYLEIDPQLKGFRYYSMRQVWEDDPAPPPGAGQARAEQATLDGLAEAYFEARDRLPYWRWGLVPAEMKATNLITHTFIHVGFLHLLGNLFFFYLVGPAMEDAWGRPLFAVFYVLSGIAAALVFVARYPNLMEPLIGASGAIAGVMGAFAVRYWNSRITFFYFVWMIRIYQGTFSAPAWIMLGLWAAGELAFAMGVWAFFSVADLGDVGFLAHVGGFVFGVGFAFLVDSLRIEERFIEPVHERVETVHESAAVEQLVELARRGRTERAMAGLERLLARSPDDAEAAAALWNIASAADVPSRAAPAVLPALEAAVRAGDAGLPAQIWTEILRRAPETEVELRTATRTAELLMREGMHGDVDTTLEWVAGKVDGSTPEGLLIRLARLAYRLNVPAPFAALALDRPDLSPDLKAELESFGSASGQSLSGFSA